MTKEISKQKIKSWWCYNVWQTGYMLSYDKETGESVSYGDEEVTLQDGSIDSGKYSTLQDAIQGFLDDELDGSNTAKIEYDETDENKFKLTATQWINVASDPADENMIELWKAGKIDFLILTKIEARFKCKSEWQASLKDYAQVMKRFTKRIIAD